MQQKQIDFLWIKWKKRIPLIVAKIILFESNFYRNEQEIFWCKQSTLKTYYIFFKQFQN